MSGAICDGVGWVYLNEDAGEEYASNHPVKSGEVPDATRIRRSTAQEDVLWQAFQDAPHRAHALSTTPSQGMGAATVERCAQDRADWLLDAIAGATQDRRFLRGDPAYDEVAGEVILLNGVKAIRVAIERAFAAMPPQHIGAPANDEQVKRVATAIRPLIETDGEIYWASEYGRPVPQESIDAIARAALTAALATDPHQHGEKGA